MITTSLLTTPEAAAMLRVHPGTLRNWRSRRYGPTYMKAGAQVRYSAHDLDIWCRQQCRP